MSALDVLKEIRRQEETSKETPESILAGIRAPEFEEVRAPQEQRTSLPTGAMSRPRRSGTSKPAFAPPAGDIFKGLDQETVKRIKKAGTTRAGTPNKARMARLADIERLRKQYPLQVEMIESMPAYESFLVGIGRGMMTVGRGLGFADPETPQERASFESLKTVAGDAVGAGELVGEVAPFAPFGLGAGAVKSLAGRAAATGLVTGIEASAIAKGRGAESGEATMEGVVAGLTFGTLPEIALPIVNRAGRKLISKLTGKVADAIDETGQFTKDMRDALDKANITEEQFLEAAGIDDFARSMGVDDATNQAREQAFAQLGLTPTEAQRTRDADLFVKQQDAFREGGAVRNALEQQDLRLNQLVDESITQARAGAAVSDDAIGAITSKALSMDDEITRLYREAAEAAPDVKNVRFVEASKAIKSLAPINERSQGTVKALRDHMIQMGVINKQMRPVGRVSVSQAEELRQFANSLFEGANAQGHNVIRAFKNALDEDALKAAGADFFDQARAAKRDFERGLTKEALHKFDKNRVSLVRDLLENRIAPEELFDKVGRGKSRYKASDLKDLKRYLFSGSDEQIEQGVRAWNNLRAEAIERIKAKSFRGPETAEGVRMLSRAGMESGLKEIGDAKLRVFFGNDELKLLRDIGKVSALKEPPPGLATGTGPSGPAIRAAHNALTIKLGTIFGPFADQLMQPIKSRARERQVLKLVDDATKIEKRLAREQAALLRRSRAGDIISAAQVTAAAPEDNENGIR